MHRGALAYVLSCEEEGNLTDFSMERQSRWYAEYYLSRPTGRLRPGGSRSLAMRTARLSVTPHSI
jgi:hypothetical protein